jgi:nucleoid-associated protein YgaU
MKRKTTASVGALLVLTLLLGGAYLALSPQAPTARVSTARLQLEEPREIEAVQRAESSRAMPDRRVAAEPDIAVDPESEVPEPESVDPEPLTRSEPLDAGASEDKPLLPSFDIVRVEPNGESVIAGRGAPDTKITVLQDGNPLAEARTDARGEFVAIPLQRLDPGDRQLTLQSRDREGVIRESKESVVIALPDRRKRTSPQPERSTGETPETEVADTSQADTASSAMKGVSQRPLAVVMPRDGGGEVRVLQKPEPEAALRAGRLRLETVQYALDGRVILAGYGTVGYRVQLYLNNAVIGSAVVSADGRWRFQPDAMIEPGLYELRIDELDGNGRVQARLETPFNSQPLLTAEEGEQVLVVQPGHNLWTIARRTYGKGWLYTTIFQANSEQIRDPDLIYPGQVFVLPEAE